MATRGPMQGSRAAPFDAWTAEATSEFSELLAMLARRWGTRRLDALDGYRRILADYGAGNADSGTTASAVARLTAEEVIKYPGELFDLATDYANGLARISGATAPGAPPWPGPEPGRAVHELMLAGKIGETATVGILIENPRDADVTIGFAATAFSNEARITRLTPSFAPASCTLAPRSEQEVIVSAKLDGRTLTAGESYSALAVVDGFDDMVLRINLDVDPA